MKLSVAAGSALACAVTSMGVLAIPGSAHAALQTLTVELNDYDFITPNGQDLAQFMAQDVATGGVNVTVTLNPTNLPNGPYYFASTGGGHITVGFNLDTTITAADITFGANDGNTFDFETNKSPPPGRLGTYDFALQGNFNGTNSHFTGPLTFHIAGVTVADFTQNVAGYYAAADFGVKGGDFTGEAGGKIATIVGTPEASTWAMMLLGFAGLGFAGYRRARGSRIAPAVA
jgi:hypothetical protein